MTDPVSVLCSAWATADDLPADLTAGVDAAVVTGLLWTASEQLYALSAQQWPGTGCSRTVEILAGVPAPEAAQVRLQTGTGHRGPVYCVELRDPQVTAITSILDQDGDPIPTDQWRRTGSRLEALSAAGQVVPWPWPLVTVTYAHGAAPPEGGRQATISLTAELIKARKADQSCRLPKRVQSITRQGVTIAVLDPFDFLKEGLTGLSEIDGWLTSVNPAKARRRLRVGSPDMNRQRTRTVFP